LLLPVGQTGVVEFVVARNPDPDSSLPFLVRLPLGDGVALKVRDTWPRTSKIYCHRADVWPDELDIVERVRVRSCVRRGASIDLVLDRGRENRSQFVFTMARGREMIFWQSARTAKQARPAVAVPRARASGQVLDIIVDSHETYPWTFSKQQATTSRRALPAGDYAVAVDGRVVAAVERKSLADLVSTLTTGKLRYLMADLASMPRSALVVEDRWSQVFKLERVRPSVVAEGIAEAQVRFPTVPIVFAETRQLAQEWTYRFLGAAITHHLESDHGAALEAALPAAPAIAPAAPPIAVVRAWAIATGFPVSDRGRLRPEIFAAYDSAHAVTD
jgi:ERCC4 domain